MFSILMGLEDVSLRLQREGRATTFLLEFSYANVSGRQSMGEALLLEKLFLGSQVFQDCLSIA